MEPLKILLEQLREMARASIEIHWMADHQINKKGPNLLNQFTVRPVRNLIHLRFA